MSKADQASQRDERALTLTLGDADLRDLVGYVRETADLTSLARLAGWDRNMAMPPGGASARERQTAANGALLRDRSTSPRVREWLERLSERVAAAPYTDAARGLARQVKREHDQCVKLPTALARELAEVTSAALEAWRRARTQRLSRVRANAQARGRVAKASR